MPLSTEELQKRNEEILRRQELEILAPIDFPEMERQVKEWLLVVDPGVIKFVCAVYISLKLARDPVWVHLVGASGSGKTELLGMLLDLPDIYSVSSLTPQTFLSGMPGKNDASLLPKLTGKTMIFKDWTSILSINKDARSEIMGQLREIYDGALKKPFGNGKVQEWRGKVGLITGVTTMVDLAQQMTTALGERFIHYRLITPDRKEVAMRALSNGDHQDEMRKALRNACYAWYKGLDIKKETPPLTKEVETEIIRVANFCTMARSGVIRDFGFKKEVIFVPAVEMPTRISQQLKTLAICCMIINKGEFQEADMKHIIYKVALDSIPQSNKMVCVQMAVSDERTTKEIATSLGYPTEPIRQYLENLSMLGVCRRIRGSDSEEGGSADRWSLVPEFAEIVQTYEKVNKPVPLTEEQQAALLAEANEALAQHYGHEENGGENQLDI